MNRKRVRLSRAMDRRRFVGLFAGSMALATAACRRTGDPAYARGNTLVMGIRSAEDVKPDATDLDKLLFPVLAAADANGELQPRLAESWERSADSREWTYHLRTDVRWSDGMPVTAHDVKFTLDLLSHPDVGEWDFDSVTVLGDFTVKARRRATFPFPYQRDIVFYPKHVLEHLEPKKFMAWDFWLRPTVSAGPYRFVRYLPETMMELEANPNYFRGKPKIERVVLKFVAGAGLNELLSGNADVVLNADPVQIPFVAKDLRFHEYHFVNSNGTRGIYWKCDHPVFQDVRVRQALTLAMDRRALLGVLNLPSDLAPITDGVFTTRQFQRGQFPEPLPYDPLQSRALLEAAGWQDRDGDGVREREGRPFRFTALVRGDQGFDRLAIYVQAQLRQVGVEMEVQVLDNGAVVERLNAGDFEAVFGVFSSSNPAPQRRYFGRNNPIGYRNPEVVKLIDQAMATADPDELDRIYRALTAKLRVELPVTRLFPLFNTSFAHRRVQGLSTPFRASPDTYMEDLWLENER